MRCWWDSRDGKTIASLSGHLDYSFASAWHPNGNTIATGNQDKTCRIWDIRNPSKSLAVLKANLGAIRSIRYSSDGHYMAMTEPADFVHVYDVKNGYEVEQEINFFGEISGMSFSPDTESLFIGVSDRTGRTEASWSMDVVGNKGNGIVECIMHCKYMYIAAKHSQETTLFARSSFCEKGERIKLRCPGEN